MHLTANALGLHLQVFMASTESDLESTFRAMVQQKADALDVMPDPFFVGQRELLTLLAARQGIPAMYPMREFVEVGG
jgi:putative ABC transport system substrate-binding protein